MSMKSLSWGASSSTEAGVAEPGKETRKIRENGCEIIEGSLRATEGTLAFTLNAVKKSSRVFFKDLCFRRIPLPEFGQDKGGRWKAGQEATGISRQEATAHGSSGGRQPLCTPWQGSLGPLPRDWIWGQDRNE